MRKRRKGVLLSLSFLTGMLFLTGWATQVQSQEKYPTRAINIIIPFGAGGGTDLSFRILAPYISKKWGVPVNPINKPGGNTVPGSLEVYGAKPDGYTLLGDSSGSLSMLGAVVKDLPFNIMDRTFISIYSGVPIVFTVPAKSPFNSLQDLAAEAKKNPTNFTWTSAGGAGTQDYAARQFFKAIGVDVLKTKPVITQSGAQGTALVAGGHVMLASAATASAIPTVKSGLAKALAVTGERRLPDLPDVPTTTELGFPTINCQVWVGPTGPPKLPYHIVEKWEKALKEMCEDPEVITQLNRIGAVPFYRNSRESKEHFRREIEDVNDLWGLK